MAAMRKLLKHKGAIRIRQVLKSSQTYVKSVKRAPRDKTLITQKALVLLAFSVSEKKNEKNSN